MTLIGIATPAWATTPTDGENPPPAATATETPAVEETPSANPSESASPSASPGGAAEETQGTEQAVTESEASASPSESSTATPDPDAAGTETPDGGAAADFGDDALEQLRDFMASFGIFFPDIEDIDADDFVANPLSLTFTCEADGTHWKLANKGPNPLGVGWFDTDLGGDFIPLAAGQTVDLDSSALAVIAHPVDEEGNVLITVPAVAVSDCEDAEGGNGSGTPTPTAAPLPVAGPATPVRAQPYYTG
jgi:hypothetical protein